MPAALNLVPREATPEPSTDDFQALIDLVIPAVYNQRTRYRYATVLKHLMIWMQQNKRFFCRVTVKEYLAHKMEEGWSSATVNQFLSAVRHLTREAMESELIPDHIAKRVLSIKCVRTVHQRKGRWMTKEQVSKMLGGIDVSLPIGLRDFVVVGCMVGAGMRRKEVAMLKCENVKSVRGRIGLYDVIGKMGKYRDIPVPLWLGAAIQQYQQQNSVNSGHLIRQCNNKGNVLPDRGRPLNEGVIEQIVKKRTAQAGCQVDPHDLRRTWAKLALAGGASLEQISLSLGHSSLIVTVRYLNLGLDHENPACDATDLMA